MQAGVVHAGRFWTTTSASSLKKSMVDAHGGACVAMHRDGRTEIVSGRTNSLAVGCPTDVIGDVLADPVAPLRSPGAIARLATSHLDQLLGYVQAAQGVPADWLPHRRSILVTRIDQSLSIDADQRVVAATGIWAETSTGNGLEPTADRSAIDLPVDALSARHRAAVSGETAHLGLETDNGPIVLPALWDGADRFDVSADALRRMTPRLPGDISATFHDSASRRPDEKVGVMFRGHGHLVSVDDHLATIAVRPTRITTWDGFEADTITL